MGSERGRRDKWEERRKPKSSERGKRPEHEARAGQNRMDYNIKQRRIEIPFGSGCDKRRPKRRKGDATTTKFSMGKLHEDTRGLSLLPWLLFIP